MKNLIPIFFLTVLSSCITYVDNLIVDTHHGVAFLPGDTLLVSNFYGISDELSTEQTGQIIREFTKCESLHVVKDEQFLKEINSQLLTYPIPFAPAPHELLKLGRISGAKYLITGRLLDHQSHPMPMDVTLSATTNDDYYTSTYRKKSVRENNPKWMQARLIVYDLRDGSESLSMMAKVSAGTLPLKDKFNNIWHIYLTNNIQTKGIRTMAKKLRKKCQCL
jgi:hypothetical protein